jgi:DNA gyrase/topoisomerase IV subunit A
VDCIPFHDRHTSHPIPSEKVDDRIHILEGREAVLLNIDEVIRIIRESDEPKPALIQAFRLSDRQAEDILEIRLRQLARLEAIKIQQELAELRKEKAGLHDLLDNPASMKKTLIKEIEADAKQFGDARRTLIEEAVRASVEQKVVDEPVTVVISDKGWCAPALVTDMKPASSRSRRVTACMARLNAARLIIYWCLARTAESILSRSPPCPARVAMACQLQR